MATNGGQSQLSAEPLWPLVREVVANEGFDDLGAMEPVRVERCRWLIDHPAMVHGAVGFHCRSQWLII